MTRTRLTFFIVLAVVLAIVALSMATQVLSSGAILSLYIAAAVFGLGVVTLDFLGILGEHGEDGGADFDGSVDADGAIDFDGSGDFDGAVGDSVDFGGGFDSSGFDSSGDGPGAHISGTEFDLGDATHGAHDGHFTDWNRSAGGVVLSILAYLRLTVYFALGFGPTGWMALATGRSELTSLAWASAVGVISLFLAQAFFRFQQSDTDSSLSAVDLLRQEATVTIPVSGQDMGKVRIKVGMSVTDQYALAANPTDSFRSGDKVYVTRVTDECVYIS